MLCLALLTSSLQRPSQSRFGGGAHYNYPKEVWSPGAAIIRYGEVNDLLLTSLALCLLSRRLVDKASELEKQYNRRLDSAAVHCLRHMDVLCGYRGALRSSLLDGLPLI